MDYEHNIIKDLIKIDKEKDCSDYKIKVVGDETYEIIPSVKSIMQPQFSFLKLDKMTTYSFTVSLPNDDEISQLISMMSDDELKEYNTVQSMLSRTEQKLALAMITKDRKG